jgi:hypothetical protein
MSRIIFQIDIRMRHQALWLNDRRPKSLELIDALVCILARAKYRVPATVNSKSWLLFGVQF